MVLDRQCTDELMRMIRIRSAWEALQVPLASPSTHQSSAFLCTNLVHSYQGKPYKGNLYANRIKHLQELARFYYAYRVRAHDFVST
jgi:hypothetical protein